MSELFDLSSLKKLVDAKHPPTVIIVDTNVLMDNPDFTKWQTDLKEPIFVLPYFVIGELSKLISKPDQETRAKAIKARDALLRLTEHGDSSKGIHIKDVGWLIMLKPPLGQALEQELDKFRIVVEISHKADTISLVIHIECTKYLGNITVLLLTGDKILTLLARAYSPLVYNAQSFPLELANWIKGKMLEAAIDPDKELQEAIERLEKKVIKVALMLTSKRLDRDWQFESSDGDKRKGVIFAEGEGILYHPDIGSIGFTWKLPYKPATSIVFASHPTCGEADIYEGHPSNAGVSLVPMLNFLGRDKEIPASLAFALMARISELQTVHPLQDSPQGAPTLQGPLAIAERMMKVARGIEAWGEERETKQANGQKLSAEEDLDGLVDAILQAADDPYVFESYEDLLEYCIKKYCAKGPIEQQDGLGTFLDSIFSVWNIGHTISFALPPKEILEAEEFLSNK